MAILPTADAIPDGLLTHDQWVAWRVENRRGTATRVPVNPRTGEVASPTDPGSWGTFMEAREHASASAADGLGYVFAPDGPFVGVVLDDCRVPATGTLTDTALDVLDRLDSYTEVMPAHSSVLTVVRGSCPAGRTRRGKVELVGTDRFVPLTGRHVSHTPPSVAARSEALAGVHRDYIQSPPGVSPAPGDSSGDSSGGASGGADTATSASGPSDETSPTPGQAESESTRQPPTPDRSQQPPNTDTRADANADRSQAASEPTRTRHPDADAAPAPDRSGSARTPPRSQRVATDADTEDSDGSESTSLLDRVLGWIFG